MGYSTDDKIIGDIKLSKDGEAIRVSRVTYKNGGEAMDIRNYYTDDKGQLSPTKKGIRVNSETLPDLMKLIFEGMAVEERIDFMDSIDYLLDKDEEYTDDDSDTPQ